MEYFRDIDKKPEEEKIRLIWFLTIVFMAGVLCLFMANAASNISKLSKEEMDLSQLPSLSEVAGPDVTEALKAGKDAIEGLDSAVSVDWGKLGDEYIANKGLSADDGFSTLKAKDPYVEGDAIILDYEHYYKDVPVLHSVLELEVDAVSHAVSVRENRLKNGIDVAIDPKISAKDAAGKAEEEMADSGYVFKESRLAIAEIDGVFYLVWKTVFAEEGKEDKVLLVGAMHGNIVTETEAAEDQTRNITQ